jgi:hypothetical protein
MNGKNRTPEYNRGGQIMLMNGNPTPSHPTHISTRSWLKILAGAVLACTLLMSTVCLAAEPKPSPSTSQREQLTIATEEATKPWTGDLDGMIKRRFIRVLTVYSKTFYTVDKGVQRGAAFDTGNLFVEDLNKKTGQGEEASAQAPQGAGVGGTHEVRPRIAGWGICNMLVRTAG